VEDEKVSIDDLQGEIEGIEDYVQSTDVVSCFSCILLRSMLIHPVQPGRNAKTIVFFIRLVCRSCCMVMAMHVCGHTDGPVMAADIDQSIAMI